MRGKRKITDIYLDGTQKLDEKELSKGLDEYIVSEDDDKLWCAWMIESRQVIVLPSPDRARKWLQYEGRSAEIVIWYLSPEDKGVSDTYKPYNLLFTNDGNGGCYVERKEEQKTRRYSGKRLHYTDETGLSAALRVFFRLTRSIKAYELDLQIVSLSEEVERILEQQQRTFLFNCKTFIIRTEDRRVPPLLFPFIRPGCALKIYTDPFPEAEELILDSDSFDLELLRAAPSFQTQGIVGITDEQLPKLRARSLSMKAPYITSKGINRIIMVCIFPVNN
ncbi:hypothetical protein OESDEN_12258 [Oesophagostomum dentatum]|uniref:Uncharacterized protein n=1 Tax=Oesophagostomum dentatum TaxID=61180 RepID=A0A0B1SSL9_OESDE|nr:hypothetical protein OESDEN_12258 [Oesophagostomum dentatum]